MEVTPIMVLLKLNDLIVRNRETVLNCCNKAFGPLSDREKEIAERSSHASLIGVITLLPCFYSKFKDDPDIKKWWDSIPENKG